MDGGKDGRGEEITLASEIDVRAQGMDRRERGVKAQELSKLDKEAEANEVLILETNMKGLAREPTGAASKNRP